MGSTFAFSKCGRTEFVGTLDGNGTGDGGLIVGGDGGLIAGSDGGQIAGGDTDDCPISGGDGAVSRIIGSAESR